MPSDGELSLCTARATDCLLSQRNADLLAQEMGNILEKVPLPLADVSNGVMKQLFYYAACKCLGSKQGLLPVPGTILLRKYREVDGRKRRDDPDAEVLADETAKTDPNRTKGTQAPHWKKYAILIYAHYIVIDLNHLANNPK
jgi:hypothetical protein